MKRALIEAAKRVLSLEGSDALSFRKLAELVGVSHSAPLAHFPDRRCLDASVASQGFRELQDRLYSVVQGQHASTAAFSPSAPKPLQEEDRRKPQPSAPEWRLASPTPTYSLLARAPAGASAPFPPPPRSTLPPGKYGTRLAATFLAYLRFALEHRGLYRTMYAPGLSEGPTWPDPGDQAAAYLRELQEEKTRAAGLFVDLIEQGQKAGEFSQAIPAARAGRLFTALAEGLARQLLEEGAGVEAAMLKEAEQLCQLALGALAS